MKKKKYILTTALLVGTISAGCIIPAVRKEADQSGWEEEPVIIINQGLGMGMDKEDGSLYPMDQLVAERGTGLFVDTAPEWKEEAEDSVMIINGNGQEWILYEGGTLSLEDESYDLDTSGGRYRIWRVLSDMQGEDYDLVVGFVPQNMQSRRGAEERSLTGFTFGEAASVISLEDTSPEVTVAHEIGHCYNLGDEYENGTFCLNYNMVPYGMQGRNADRLSETVSGNCPYIKGGPGNEEQGTGTVISKEQYAYDITTNELIDREMTSLMGLSGYSAEEYWSTTDIWNTMYNALTE